VKGEGDAKASAQAKEARDCSFVLKLRVSPPRYGSRSGSATPKNAKAAHAKIISTDVTLLLTPKAFVDGRETVRSFELVRESLIRGSVIQSKEKASPKHPLKPKKLVVPVLMFANCESVRQGMTTA
jgi:hypothetical protein